MAWRITCRLSVNSEDNRLACLFTTSIIICWHSSERSVLHACVRLMPSSAAISEVDAPASAAAAALAAFGRNRPLALRLRVCFFTYLKSASERAGYSAESGHKMDTPPLAFRVKERPRWLAQAHITIQFLISAPAFRATGVANSRNWSGVSPRNWSCATRATGVARLDLGR